ncbi:hypothetical protein [Miniimonas sp. S16]|uniref:hypothetical protein n=1 Tax=Miniimonas sp. S16 TaxID=2171623 RepID=UPI000D529051|nr:hypothetical protein [Miniimonas sp. S16]
MTTTQATTAVGPTTSLRVTARSAAHESTEYGDPVALGLAVEVAVATTGPWPRTVTLSVTNTSEADFLGVVHAEVLGDLAAPDEHHPPATRPDPGFLLPGFLVGRNRGEAPMEVTRRFPRLRPGTASMPASPWWMVRADRLTHPVAAAVGRGRLVAVSASPYLVGSPAGRIGWSPGASGAFAEFTGFTCSLENGSVGVTLGSESAPWSFVQSTDVSERAPLETGATRIRPGEHLTIDLTVWDVPAAGPDALDAVVEHVYRAFHTPPRPVGDPRRAARELATAVRDAAWLEDLGAYAGFVFQAADGSRTYRELPSLTWTNGLAVATPMLLAALRLDDGEMRRQALHFLDGVVKESLNPRSGLPFDSKVAGEWAVGGWWFDLLPAAGHSGYLVGQAVVHLLDAYDHEARLGDGPRQEWLAFAAGVIDRLQLSRDQRGEYPYLLSPDAGTGIEYDSTGPVWALAAAARYVQLTGDRAHLPDLLASEAHYHRTYVQPRECYGGPLDVAKAVDSEGILGYIKAVRWLHEVTGEQDLLDHLRDAVAYELTFRFGWNVPVQVPPLSEIGWSSVGGSVTSTANPHIHPMGSLMVDELHYYLRHREDPYLASRLRDVVGWGCQTYNLTPHEYGHGDVGWMSERFCYSEGLLTERYPDGSPASTWFCLMPWASGCVIRGMVGDLWDETAGTDAPETSTQNGAHR